MEHDAVDRLARLERQLSALARPLEQVAGRALTSAESAVGSVVQPAWRRVTAAEPRWPVSLVLVGMIALQLLVPARFAVAHPLLLPGVELLLLVVLVASDPRRVSQRTTVLRGLGLALIGVASLANGWALGHLVDELLHGKGGNATQLLATGSDLYLTNIIIFGLWYWEFDRGGPGARACGQAVVPDFLFPQLTAPELFPDWEPMFLDYFYVSFTNATAFSPTDTMPLSRWAKLAMMTQSAIALITAALVVARAVNVLQ